MPATIAEAARLFAEKLPNTERMCEHRIFRHSKMMGFACVSRDDILQEARMCLWEICLKVASTSMGGERSINVMFIVKKAFNRHGLLHGKGAGKRMRRYHESISQDFREPPARDIAIRVCEPDGSVTMNMHEAMLDDPVRCSIAERLLSDGKDRVLPIDVARETGLSRKIVSGRMRRRSGKKRDALDVYMNIIADKGANKKAARNEPCPSWIKKHRWDELDSSATAESETASVGTPIVLEWQEGRKWIA